MIAATAAVASFSGHQLAARPLTARPLTARPLATRARPTQLLDVGTFLYEAQITADALVQQQFQQLTPASALVLYAAGLLTSLTPCCLAMLPLTIGFIGGLEEEVAATADCCTDGGAAPAAAAAAAVVAAALVPAVVAAAVVVPAAPPAVAAVPVPVSPVVSIPVLAARAEGAVHAGCCYQTWDASLWSSCGRS